MAATGHVFPNIEPSQRQYTPGTFPTRDFQGLNGALTTLQYGSKEVDSKLEMTFQNITDDQAMEIFDNYLKVNNGRRGSTGERDYLLFSPAASHPALAGIRNTELRERIAERIPNGPQLRYRYEEPPVITSVFPGRSTVQIKLRGYLEGAIH
jgi:hypothetical protein